MICKRCGEREGTTTHIVGVIRHADPEVEATIDSESSGCSAIEAGSMIEPESPLAGARPIELDLCEMCLAQEVGPERYTVYSLFRQLDGKQISVQELSDFAAAILKPKPNT